MPRRVVVLGAGIAGLASSLLLAQDGHRVTLLESDPVLPSGPEDAFSWERRGITHFLQPHAFIPRGRKELIEHFGDVYERLLRSGAWDCDLRLDEQRLRMWEESGSTSRVRRATTSSLVSLCAGGATALMDPDVFRIFVRRFGLLDSTRVLDEDLRAHQRIEILYRELRTRPRPAAGSTHEAVLPNSQQIQHSRPPVARSSDG